MYHPPPLQLAPFSSNPLGMPGMPTGPGPGPPQPNTNTNTNTVTEARLRAIESGMRNLSTVPSTLHNIDLRLDHIQRGQDSLQTRLANTLQRGMAQGDVSNSLKEAYTMRAWPLAPWLVGLREVNGLAGMVTAWMGKATLGGGEDVGVMEEGVRAEIARLVIGRSDWRKEEVKALGIYA
jgi:hypothetical protein